MQIEKCEAQRAIEKKMLIFVLFLMQQFEHSDEARQFTEFSLSSRFQIAQQIMFAVAFTINLIIVVSWIFA